MVHRPWIAYDVTNSHWARVADYRIKFLLRGVFSNKVRNTKVNKTINIKIDSENSKSIDIGRDNLDTKARPLLSQNVVARETPIVKVGKGMQYA